MFDLIIQGGICLTPAGRIQTDIAIKQGKIVALGDFAHKDARETLNAANLHILPGVIDTQVHFRQPGFTHKETIKTGAMAAAMGGVTGFFEMPNTNPATLDAEKLQEKLNIAKAESIVNYAFYVGGSEENFNQLPTLEKIIGVAGVKIFMGSSTGSLLVETEEILRKILQNGKSPIAIHAEDEQRLKQRFQIARDAANPKAHPIWRDSECAVLATKRIIALAQETDRPIHILHISTRDEIPLLAAHKGLVSAEITPQHLTLQAPEIYEKLGTYAQMNPPLRDKTHQDALWQALDQGVFDILGSDHAPHTKAEKTAPYPQSPSGMPGVQTLLPVMLTHIHHERLSLERFVDLTATGPARIFQLKGKGRIAQGFDADFTLVDLKKQKMITHSQMQSLSGWTPFDGFQATGWAIATIVAGNLVMREDTLLTETSGKAFEFIR